MKCLQLYFSIPSKHLTRISKDTEAANSVEINICVILNFWPQLYNGIIFSIFIVLKWKSKINYKMEVTMKYKKTG
jgi:hypothetical protein